MGMIFNVIFSLLLIATWITIGSYTSMSFYDMYGIEEPKDAPAKEKIGSEYTYMGMASAIVWFTLLLFIILFIISLASDKVVLFRYKSGFTTGLLIFFMIINIIVAVLCSMATYNLGKNAKVIAKDKAFVSMYNSALTASIIAGVSVIVILIGLIMYIKMAEPYPVPAVV